NVSIAAMPHDSLQPGGSRLGGHSIYPFPRRVSRMAPAWEKASIRALPLLALLSCGAAGAQDIPGLPSTDLAPPGGSTPEAPAFGSPAGPSRGATGGGTSAE